MAPEELLAEIREIIKRLLAYGARFPKVLMLYVKDLLFLDGALATLAPDVDLFDGGHPHRRLLHRALRRTHRRRRRHRPPRAPGRPRRRAGRARGQRRRRTHDLPGPAGPPGAHPQAHGGSPPAHRTAAEARRRRAAPGRRPVSPGRYQPNPAVRPRSRCQPVPWTASLGARPPADYP